MHILSIVDLAVPCSNNANVTAPPTITPVRAFVLPAAPHSVSIPERYYYQDGKYIVIVGCVDGSILRLRCSMPASSMALDESGPSIQVDAADISEDVINDWVQPHHGPAFVDASTDTVSSAGLEGGLAITDLETGACSYLLSPSKSSLPCGIAFVACRRNGPHTCLTASMQGTINLWDTRIDSRKRTDDRLSSAQSWTLESRNQGGNGRQRCHAISSLAVHPADVHLCATGDQGGTVALWDLRVGSSEQKASQATYSVDGVVNTVAYGPRQIVIGTERGMLGVIGDSSVHAVYEEPCASIEALTIGHGNIVEEQVFASTDQEVMLYLANVLG